MTSQRAQATATPLPSPLDTPEPRAKAVFPASELVGRKRRILPSKLAFARKLRKEQTRAEGVLWQALRNRRCGGIKFHRQHNVGRYILDFYSIEANLAIEVDGPIHQYQQQYDQQRTDWLSSQGVRVIRFTNEQVLTQLPSVMQAILAQSKPNESGEQADQGNNR